MKLPKLSGFSKPKNEEPLHDETIRTKTSSKKSIKNIIQWCAVGLMVLFALAMLPHLSALIFLLAALVCVPQEAMASFLAKTPLGSGARPGWLAKASKNWAPIAVALFLVGCITGGSAQAAQTSQAPSEEEPPVEQDIVPSTQEELDRAEVTPSTAYLEYSIKAVDPMSLINYDSDSFGCHTSDEIDLSSLGAQDVTYTLSNDAGTKDQVVTFEVRDTKAPQIIFAKSELTVEQDSAFDPLANVTSVSDPVDGPLVSVAEEPTAIDGTDSAYETGWYITTDQVDTSTPGTYKVSIVACDIHGNRTEKGYMVTVAAKAIDEPAETSATEAAPSQGEATTAPETNAQAAPAQEPQTKTYILNTNTRKFHLPGCSSANRVKASNRQEVEATREDLIAQGYEPCSKCNP